MVDLINKAVIAATLAALAFSGCSNGKDKTVYEAEKALFSARKMKSQLSMSSIQNDFLDRTVKSYKDLIETYGKDAGQSAELQRIVSVAAIDVSELEFRAGRLSEARDDFLTAYRLASDIPEARANALWSAAFVSEQMKDAGRAIELYSRFMDEYMSPDSAAATAAMNPRYLVTPIKLSGLYDSQDRKTESASSLDMAEQLYRALLKGSPEPGLAREIRYDLLTALLQGRRWSKARSEIAEMKKLYSGESDLPKLLFLEARVELDGFKDSGRALEIFSSIYEGYPSSNDATRAMLAAAGILLGKGSMEEAKELYSRVAHEKGADASDAAEALWQLASIDVSENDWADASLKYKSVYTSYPGTLQGMEAPLVIVRHFDDLSEKAAADAAWQSALDHYEKMRSGQYPESVKIMAEQYYIRTLTIRDRWKEAAEGLLELPGRYPDYYGFRGNCLMAASIFENELGDTARAAEILEKCASRYDGTGLADEARRQIDRIRGAR